MNNYRKIYAEHFGINIPRNYEIHHIDGNKKNNCIENLILLPKKIHQDYHKSLKKVEMSMVSGLSTKATQHASLGMQYGYIGELLEVEHQIGHWDMYRYVGYPKEWKECQ